MKIKLLFVAFALLAAGTSSSKLSAQTAADEAAVRQMWDAVWQAYQSNDEAKMWSFYAEGVCEIYPDGQMACGAADIKAGYEQFKTMLDGQPKWSVGAPTVRFIGADVAVLVADVTSDIRLKGGQQIGGKSKFSAIVHREKGRWLIAFDQQTPVMEMPVGN